jgi:hypothetical protein
VVLGSVERLPTSQQLRECIDIKSMFQMTWGLAFDVRRHRRFEDVVSCVSFSSLASTVLHLGLGGILHCFGCLRLCIIAYFLGCVF